MQWFSILWILFFTRNIDAFNRTYMLFVSEDVPIGHTQIIDTFEPRFCLMYSVKPVYQDSPFEIILTSFSNCTLDLHVNHRLDREQKSMYTLEQELIDEARQMIVSIQLSILILDVNDHIPQFESEHFQFSVRENIQPGTFIGRVQAYDPDILLNGRIDYALIGNDLEDNRTVFRIDRDTGEIFLSDFVLDYERVREYTMMVEARDHGNMETTLWPSVSSYADVTIRVEDVNDEKPEIVLTTSEENQAKIMSILKPQLDKEQTDLIHSFHSNIHLIENDAELIYFTKEEPLPMNTPLASLHLRDRDQVSHGFLSLHLQTYVPCSSRQISINQTFCQENNLFHLSVLRANVYGLFTSRILDREEYEYYFIHLIVDDNDNTTAKSFQSELFIYLLLLDINDNNPVFDQPYLHLTTDENQPLLTRVHAYDLDKGVNGTVRYELMVKNNELFTLDEYTGILQTKDKLDREQCEVYRIGIRAYDLGFPERKYSTIMLVDIEVENVNDHVSYFVHGSYRFEVMENAPIGKIIGRVTIDDRDKQEPMEYMINLSTVEEDFKANRSKKISSIDYPTIDFLFVDSRQNQSLSNFFSIDPHGYLHALVSFDREFQSNYSFYVSIYDFTLKSSSLPTHIFIEILDENDNPPFEPFLSNPSVLFLEHVDNKETIIYEFHPTDRDVGLNGHVTIECLNCTSIFYFPRKNSSLLTTRSHRSIPTGFYTLAFLVRDHGLIISHQRWYTLTFHLTHRAENSFKLSWPYFSILWLIICLVILHSFYRSYQLKSSQEEHEKFQSNSMVMEKHCEELHPISSHHLSRMNSKETMYTNAVTNTTSCNEIWQPMNNPNRYENLHAYQFQPIKQDRSPNSGSSQVNIQRPVPISHAQNKRNSTMNIDSTSRSYGIMPRSITSDQLAHHSNNRLYHYPSVQDVLDALNRRSFEKESFV